tara:strand:- start:54 stop:467 length:414 start_codon:yes stop_codon:yes gene_type:complete
MQISRKTSALKAEADERYQILSNGINVERNRRITCGFMFANSWFDFDDNSKARIQSAATLAGFAITKGAALGDFYWNSIADPFVWISTDNSLISMDAQTCFALGEAAAAHESKYIFLARAIKDTSPIPEDFTDDSYW